MCLDWVKIYLTDTHWAKIGLTDAHWAKIGLYAMPKYLSIQVSETVIIHEKESEIGRMLAPTHEEDFSSK